MRLQLRNAAGRPRPYVVGGQSFTLDRQEVANFGVMARRQIENGYLLRFLQNLMLPWEGATVLDLGCGPGTWAVALQALGVASVTCHDASPAMLEFAQQLHEELSIHCVRYAQRDLTDLAYNDASFDIVICCHALYYSSDEEYTVREVARVLRPLGFFYVQSPSWKRMIYSYQGPIHKRIGAAIAPVIPILFGRKFIPTAFSWSWATDRYCRRSGLIRSRSVDTGHKDIFGTLYTKQVSPDTG